MCLGQWKDTLLRMFYSVQFALFIPFFHSSMRRHVGRAGAAVASFVLFSNVHVLSYAANGYSDVLLGMFAFAAVVFGRWNPIGIFLGTILFGLGDALQIRLQAYGVQVPYQLLEMLPYLITLFALVVFMRNARGPAASGTPFIEEE